jgi:potassium efflux system protein
VFIVAPSAAGRGRAFLASVLLAFAAPALQAQMPARFAPADASVETLQRQATAAAEREDIDQPTKARIEGTYRRAVEELNRARQLAAETEALRKATVDAPAQIAQLERQLELAEQQASRPVPAPSVDGIATEDVAQRVTDERLTRDRMQLDVDSLARAIAEIEQRAAQTQRRREDAQSTLIRLRAELGETRAGRTTLAQATEALRSARIEALQAELDWLDREVAYRPTQTRITRLKRDLARLQLAGKNAELQAWLDALAKKNQQDIEKARAAAAQAESTLGRHATVPLRIAAENAESRVQLAQATAQLDRALRDLSDLRARTADIEVGRRSVERATEGQRLGAESSEQLVERLGRLPTLDRFASARADRALRLQEASERNLKTERELESLADLTGAVATALVDATTGMDATERAALENAVRGELGKRRALLLRISEQQKAHLQVLRQTASAEDDLLARSAEARKEILSLLLWIPLNAVSATTVTELRQAVDWMVSPENWRQVYDALVEQAERRPFLLVLAVAVIVAAYAQRGRWKRQLANLAPAAVSVEEYSIGHTLLALLLTVLLAAPGALVLWLTGSALEFASGASPFVLSIGNALTYVSLTFVTLYGFSWLFDARGVAVKHFQWPAEAMVALQRAIRRFMFVYVPLVFLAVANGQHAPYVSRDSLGRLAFIAAMLALSAFLWIEFRGTGPVSQSLMPEGSRRWAARLRPLWVGLAVVLPAALAALSAAGFHLAAIAMFALLKSTLLVVLAAVILYGMVALWVLVQRARLARRQAAALTAAEQRAELGSDEGRPAPRMAELDVSAISDQSRRLLNLLTTVTLAAGLWLIWGKALPLFDVFGDIALWRYVDTIDGEQVSGTVSLGTVVLAVVILGLAYVGMRNIGAVLDMVLLQRLELQKDATYAIKTVSRYLIIGVGLILASNTLHISWDRLQWLVAALGVGLGFGLQEIVANFVSGLIVLGERPIRIGDVVTVGDVTGTVARIRARATVVTDWDNKEIMIPNKAFITERVVNWTLSSQTTRLLVKVGVAYGSDTARTQRVMLEAVTAIPEVLKEPAPSVYFLGFGESSLDFEIRAFVDAFDKRLPTLHAIHFAVEQALRAAGIEIPFPQRDLHIRSADGLAGSMMKGPVAGSGTT